MVRSASPAGSSWCQQRTFRESAVPSAWAVVGAGTSLLLGPLVILSSALGQQEFRQEGARYIIHGAQKPCGEVFIVVLS